MNYWFTSDTHFSHANIIKYCNRPFKSLEEMDSTIIKNWNSKVKEDDIVYELGDFNFSNSPGGKKGEGTTKKANYYDRQLNGKIIHILGNHTKNNRCKTNIFSIILRFGGMSINLVHNPQHANFDYPVNLVGHVHNRWKCKRIFKNNKFTDCVNVGVDVFGFKPVNWQDIMKRYHQWKKENNYV